MISVENLTIYDALFWIVTGTWQDYEGILIKPKTNSEQKCPLVVFPHGNA